MDLFLLSPDRLMSLGPVNTDRDDKYFYLKQFCPCKSVFPSMAISSFGCFQTSVRCADQVSHMYGTIVADVLRHKKWRPVLAGHSFTCYVFLYDGSFYFTYKEGTAALLQEKKPNQNCLECIFTRCSQDCWLFLVSAAY